MHDDCVLSVSGLRVETRSGAPIVQDVSFFLRQGEVLGVVGESGSGKTTTALALFGYTHAEARITAGKLMRDGQYVDAFTACRSVPGRLISYVPQSPGTALNPSLRVRTAIQDVIDAQNRLVDADAISSTLERVGLPTAAEFERRFPHQLSGGQQQRVCTAIAIVGRPPVIVLDEPTTGLDVITQARVIEELSRLRRIENIAMIYVTHDLSVVSQIADRIAVMYAGRIVEQGPTADVVRRPRHPYTRGLLASVPDHAHPRHLEPMRGMAPEVGRHPPGCPFEPRCPQSTPECTASLPPSEPIADGHEVRCFHWRRTPALNFFTQNLRPRNRRAATTPLLEVQALRAEHRVSRGRVVAAEDVTFVIHPRECVALVGESGSGKTTIARTIVGLHPPARGRILLRGSPLAAGARQRSVDERRRLQIVFQNPTEALNPRHTVGDTLAWPARSLRGLSREEATRDVAGLLDKVKLPQRIAGRYPAELSGGERQRVCIARALAVDPEVIICDEITSALDVSVQAAVLELLSELRSELGLSLLFITHNLALVATIADYVLVLHDRRVHEEGSAEQILQAPRQDYTRRLVDAAPSLTAAMAAPLATDPWTISTS